MLHTLEQDYDLVLAGIDEPTLEIAKQYLEEAGIPALLDREQASLGVLGRVASLGQLRLFVPKGMKERADAVLRELRGQSQELDRLVQAGLVPGAELADEPENGGMRISRETLALIAAVALAALALALWLALRR